MLAAAEFWQAMQEKGQVDVPCLLLEKHQALDIPPEELGYLLLAIYRQRQHSAGGAGTSGDGADAGPPQQGKDPWIGWALEKGWASWKGEGPERRVVFEPLWQKLYQIWEQEQKDKAAEKLPLSGFTGDFDYGKVVKELDRLRGSLSLSIREEQLIQEFNIRYGWSTDFVLNFFRLCCQRNLIQIKNYKPIAAQIHRAGIYTLDGLTSYMNEVDWISRQASEIKRDYLGLYGMVTVMEKDYYVKWHIAWRFSHMLIVRAARESAGAANATFKFVDSILERWHGLGVDSLEACEEAIRAWNEDKKRPASVRSPKAGANPGGKKGDKGREASLWNGFLEGEERA